MKTIINALKELLTESRIKNFSKKVCPVKKTDLNSLSFGAVVDFLNEDRYSFKMKLSRSNYTQEGITTFYNNWELKNRPSE